MNGIPVVAEPLRRGVVNVASVPDIQNRCRKKYYRFVYSSEKLACRRLCTYFKL